MQYLTVRNLHKSFTHKVIFDGLDMIVNAGQRVALVAGNGAWKTTLFRCLTGDMSFPEWTVERSDKITIWQLTQQTELNDNDNVLDVLFDDKNTRAKLIKDYERIISAESLHQDEYDRLVDEIDELDAWSYESRVRVVIAQLKLKNYLHKTIGILSGGEKKRVALAKLLIEEPDFLLLDEPTNHLDVVMIEWLEDYIRRHDFTLLMVTHDRYFLENVCTDIYELEAGEIYRYPGNYSYFLEQKARRDAQEKKELHDMKQLYRKELEWMRTAPRARESKSVYRSKNFYSLESDYKVARKKFHQKVQWLELGVKLSRLWWKIMKVEGMTKSFGEQKIVQDFNYEFQQGERVWIVWPNGVGKSTFIRLLLGDEPMDAWKIDMGKTVVFGHYTQEHIDFDPSKKVLEIVRDVAEYITVADGSKLSATKLLERFMFPPKQQHGFVRFLSWWEKRRLSLLLVLLRNPNFLILDEPTNDLDVQTIQVLEQFLLAYAGCLVVISHDRFFMDKVVEHLFVFEGDGKISDFWWSYTDYRDQKSSIVQKDITVPIEPLKEITPELLDEPIKQKKLSYLEQREFDRLGQEIESLEEKKAVINNKFQQTSIPYKEIKSLWDDMKQIIAQIEEKEGRRLALLDKIA